MTEPLIVCNSGPLIALAMVGRLELLGRLYRRVLVPAAVHREVAGSGGGRIGAAEIESASWLERPTIEPEPEPLLAMELGPGEAAVISLAHHIRADLVLLDERRARRIAAQAYELRVKGSAGILVQAERAGLVQEVRPLLDSMMAQGYRFSRRVLERATQEAGESMSK